MNEEARKQEVEKKAYQQPTLVKREQLVEVTEGVAELAITP